MTLVQFDSPSIPGLQIVVDGTTGKVYANPKALARLIDKSDKSVRNHETSMAQRGVTFEKIKAEILTSGGLQGASLFGEDFIISLIEKHKPSLLAQMAIAGMRLYFYEVAGYNLDVRLKLANQAFDKVSSYVSDKPGLENIVNHAVYTSTHDEDLLTVEDILKRYDKEYTKGDLTAIGMYASTSYRNLTGKAPAKIRVVKRDKSGRKQYYPVAAYPVDFLPVLENAITLGFAS